VNTSFWHDGPLHTVPVAHSAQAPAPLQTPVVPHVAALWFVHAPAGSGRPAATAPQMPSCPWPFVAAEQAWQVPVHALRQHTPSVQKLVTQSLPWPHVAPGAQRVGHVAGLPPQSTPVSEPFLTPSLQLSEAPHPSDAWPHVSPRAAHVVGTHVDASVPASAVALVHVTLMDAVFPVQATPESATSAVTVTTAVPAPVHAKVGDAPVVLLNVPVPVPPVTAQSNVTSELPPRLSTPCADSETAPPTLTDVGLAESDDTAAQELITLTLPLTLTWPLLPPLALVAMHATFTETFVMAFAAMANGAEPAQGRPVDVVVFNVIV
jgi:hypothetical protein